MPKDQWRSSRKTHRDAARQEERTRYGANNITRRIRIAKGTPLRICEEGGTEWRSIKAKTTFVATVLKHNEQRVIAKHKGYVICLNAATSQPTIRKS